MSLVPIFTAAYSLSHAMFVNVHITSNTRVISLLESRRLSLSRPFLAKNVSKASVISCKLAISPKIRTRVYSSIVATDYAVGAMF